MTVQTVRMLWGIAYETWDMVGNQPVNLSADIQYEQAESEAEAREQFLRFRPTIERKLRTKRAKILAIAPAIGYTILDKDGLILAV